MSLVNDVHCLVLCRRVHSLLLLGLLPVVGYFYASLRRFLLLLFFLFIFFFFVISLSFVVVTNRVFVARRPTCSVRPDAFLFWRRFDLPSSSSPLLLLGYPRYPVSKSKKHTPSGEGDTGGRGGSTTGGAKLSSPTLRVFETKRKNVGKT